MNLVCVCVQPYVSLYTGNLLRAPEGRRELSIPVGTYISQMFPCVCAWKFLLECACVCMQEYVCVTSVCV